MNEINIITNKNTTIIPNSSSESLIISGGLSIRLNNGNLMTIINEEGKINSDLVDDDYTICNHKFVTE